MYAVHWDRETRGVVLSTSLAGGVQGAVRPVFFEELDLLGFSDYWDYSPSDAPLLWAVGRQYFYEGRLVAEAQGGDFFEKPQLKVHERGLQLEPVDVAAMVEKNRPLLEGLVHRALDRISAVYRRYRRRVDITGVAFSGGKDSLVLLDLA